MFVLQRYEFFMEYGCYSGDLFLLFWILYMQVLFVTLQKC